MSEQETRPLWDMPKDMPGDMSGKGRQSASTKKPSRKGKVQRGQKVAAHANPIARVLVDIPLAHLDRTFDYQVPDKLDDAAVPGCRVRVRFAGQLVDGFLLERADTTEHKGKLAFLERVTSSEPVLSPRLATMARLVADRYSGTMIDVLRLAIPPRHASVEQQQVAVDTEAYRLVEPDPQGWDKYRHGTTFIDALRAGRAAHAVWQALPGEDWPTRLAQAAVITAVQGRGALIVVPDQRDLTRLHQACAALVDERHVVTLTASLGPAERYRRWLAVSRGAVHIVLGTRAAMFAPIANPGLFVVWDDGDDLHVDPRMPYPQVRDVLMLRAHTEKASLMVAGFNRSTESQLLVESGWAHPIVADPSVTRAAAPRVTPIGEDFDVARDAAARTARLPTVAFEAAREALAAGAPVLVQVPRRGYVPAIACGQCRTPARCRRCAGPLALPGNADRPAGPGASGSNPPICRWCGVSEARFRCGACGSTKLRAVVIGAKRTAEELGRAFAGATVRTSGGSHVLESVPAGPALVVCTPGAEPLVEDGYGAALLLDGWALLGRQDLRAAEETLRRWMAASALVRPAARGGRVVVGAEAELTPVQALIRWDPAWQARRELAERRELGFPPATRMASVEGSPVAVAALVDELTLPEAAEILGPVPLGGVDEDGNAERERALIRVPQGHGKELANALAVAQAARSARKVADTVRIQVDPLEII